MGEQERFSATIRDVAERAGVSIATVSRVFSGGARVTEDIGRRLRAAALSVNYQPNRVARNLRVRQTRTVGVIVPDIENPFYTSVIGGIEEVLQASEYSLLLANSNENPKREQANVRTFQGEGVAGIIFASTGDTAIYSQLLAASVPLVAVSRVPEDLRIDTVSVANRAGARSAIEHLVKLGHKRIGFISGPSWITTAKERVLGYEEGLSAAGIGVDRGLIQYADFRQRGGYEAMRELLRLKKVPSAVFVGSNLMTLGALQAIHEDGIRIPEDLAVVGFDDLPWAVSLNPPLTAVAQPAYQVGLTAARLLLDRLGNRNRAVRNVVLETSLTIRASCGAGQKNS
jgi:LacI family transcriptional regulator